MSWFYKKIIAINRTEQNPEMYFFTREQMYLFGVLWAILGAIVLKVFFLFGL